MRFFEFNENKMKGGTDLNKFMGYKGKDLADPSNRKLPKVIAIDPFKNQGAQLKKLGSKKQGYGYYDEEITVEDTQDFHEEFGELRHPSFKDSIKELKTFFEDAVTGGTLEAT